MEANPPHLLSNTSSPPAKKFDVFLSFRGEDTRNNFTGHLSLALRKIGLFNIFKDDYALNKGKDIGPELMKAIEASQWAVVVLSENYATSSWCLLELAKIVECMGDSGRIRTIFYHVNPSHVRNAASTDVKKQKESRFWKALEEHANNPSQTEYVESWRNALVKVANQSGHPVEAHTDEAIFIKDFVANISSELGASTRTIDGLFGMTSRLKKLDSYVIHPLNSDNICFLGIHGMGGSVIIVTTRNENILGERYKIYRAQQLDDDEALQLFSWKAFERIEPPDEFKELSEEVVKYASYLPLALKVLGSLLRRKEKRFDKNHVIEIMDCCGFDSKYGISNLVDKSLLSINEDGKIWMHDLLKEMGKDMGRQSRIRNENQYNEVLENEEGTDQVEAIVVCDQREEYIFDALSSLKKLRLLQIETDDDSAYLRLNIVVDCLPCLDGLGHYDVLPNSLHLKVIDLSYSRSFTKFEDFKVVPNLEKLILRGCCGLQKIHPSIEHLKSLFYWTWIWRFFDEGSELPNKIQYLDLIGFPTINYHQLALLDLEGCESLEKFPEEINGLASLQSLRLRRCFKLEKLGDNLEQLKSLRNLDIDDSCIKQLPSSFFLMENLESVSGNENLIESAVRENIISYRTGGKCFSPDWFCASLRMLNLSDCDLTGPDAFPEYFGKLVNLCLLDLSKILCLSCLRGLVDYPILQLLAYCLACTELVRRQDGGMTALASLSRFLQLPSTGIDSWEFRFVVPHSDKKLPSWFINQSPTASISIKLGPNWHSRELIGIAMVFCCRANSSPEDSVPRFVSLCGRKHRGFTRQLGVIDSPMSDHLFLLYIRNSLMRALIFVSATPWSCHFSVVVDRVVFVWESSHAVATQRPSSSSATCGGRGGQALQSPKRSRGRHGRLPSTGAKATMTQTRNQFYDLGSKILNLRADITMRRSQSEGTLGAF
ncbi:hypothetical protein FNV43_RR08541 [Rhamnella rubrinervis]|uniref:TIR domain-containing protein n=1 Tax=Rhamnella rubrinervis TaxID=2594499 RepID=A0A8K0H8T6_9ROSA|nr:hypothetical protein FNV43_RR08541 [Rhamnella rubrinervis]